MGHINKIFVLYEQESLDGAARRGAEGWTIICLDYLLEIECQRREIPYVPLNTVVDSDQGEEGWWQLTHDIAREWFRLSGMEFFSYQRVRVGEVPESIMQAYLAKLFYYVRIFELLKVAYPDATYVVHNPAHPNHSMECLVILHPWAVVDAAQMVGLIRTEAAVHSTLGRFVFEPATWKHWALKIFNVVVATLIPRRKRKIYLSGYWNHAESLIPHLKDTEIIVLETKNFRKVPLKQIIEHRMRFMYSHDPVSASEERQARERGETFMRQWVKSRSEVSRYLYSIRKDINWSPVLDACEHIIWYSPRIVADIDTIYNIMEKEKPNLILQMASMGGPHHYFLLMAHVARALKIPSVEMQHATVTSDPRSIFSRIETDYLLTYGKSINDLHAKIGNTHRTCIATGSPRFDRYTTEQERGRRVGEGAMSRLGLDIKKPILLVAVPFSETYASAVDSYELIEFFQTIRDIQKQMPGLQILFKCRVPKLVEPTKEYITPLFSEDWAVTGEEDIFSYICACDAVVCNNSTVIYQAVIASKPLVLFPWKKFDSYHAEIYSSYIPVLYTRADAVPAVERIFSDDVYKRSLLEKQHEFLKGYLFDGKSSERTAGRIFKIIDDGCSILP